MCIVYVTHGTRKASLMQAPVRIDNRDERLNKQLHWMPANSLRSKMNTFTLLLSVFVVYCALIDGIFAEDHPLLNDAEVPVDFNKRNCAYSLFRILQIPYYLLICWFSL